jgi:hypothetical protein
MRVLYFCTTQITRFCFLYSWPTPTAATPGSPPPLRPCAHRLHAGPTPRRPLYFWPTPTTAAGPRAHCRQAPRPPPPGPARHHRTPPAFISGPHPPRRHARPTAPGCGADTEPRCAPRPHLKTPSLWMKNPEPRIWSIGRWFNAHLS